MNEMSKWVAGGLWGKTMITGYLEFGLCGEKWRWDHLEEEEKEGEEERERERSKELNMRVADERQLEKEEVMRGKWGHVRCEGWRSPG